MLWLNKIRKKFSDEENIEDLQFFHHELLAKVIYFEWILLLVAFIGEYTALQLSPSDSSAPHLQTSLIFLFIVFLLSFAKPMRSTYWDRMCFLFLEVVLLTGCAASGLPSFVLPLYMVSIAKACLLLDKRGRVTIFIAAFLSQIAYGSFKYCISTSYAHSLSLTFIFNMLGSALIMNYAAIALMILVGMLTLSLVAEKKTRIKSERLAKEVETLATELERTRIAREIHDSLGHTLTSMNIQLEVARKFAERDHKRSIEALDLAKQLAKQSLTDVRMAVQSIRYPDFNLKDAIEELANQIQQTKSLHIKVNFNVPEVSQAVSYQLYRIIQEGLTNVLKHADASETTVELNLNDKNLEIKITDNGKGFQLSNSEPGFGIRGMQERVESLHGALKIESALSKGTELKVIIPL